MAQMPALIPKEVEIQRLKKVMIMIIVLGSVAASVEVDNFVDGSLHQTSIRDSAFTPAHWWLYSHFVALPLGWGAVMIYDRRIPSLRGPNNSVNTGLKITIIGRTNVGKSMLMNSILGQERSIVTPEAGTTRDALDTYMSYDGHDVTLIDTAGMRRRGLVQRGIEKFSVIRAVNAVGRSDITLLVIDATELATAQDSHIAGLAWEMCRGLVVVVNKWDLAEDGSRYAQQVTDDRIREKIHFMSYVPIVFTSALHGRGIDPLMRTVLELQQERSRFVPARELQYVMARALSSHSPPPVKGHSRERVYFSRLRQVGVNPPTFLFTVDKPWLVHFSYERYLENQIRTNFGFDHTHLKLVFKKA